MSASSPHPMPPPRVTAEIRADGVFHHWIWSRRARHETGRSSTANSPVTAIITDPTSQCISTAPAKSSTPATTPGSSTATRTATAASATINPSASALSKWLLPVIASGAETPTASP